MFIVLFQFHVCYDVFTVCVNDTVCTFLYMLVFSFSACEKLLWFIM